MWWLPAEVDVRGQNLDPGCAWRGRRMRPPRKACPQRDEPHGWSGWAGGSSGQRGDGAHRGQQWWSSVERKTERKQVRESEVEVGIRSRLTPLPHLLHPKLAGRMLRLDGELQGAVWGRRRERE
jgi:hypothetical protein